MYLDQCASYLSISIAFCQSKCQVNTSPKVNFQLNPVSTAHITCNCSIVATSPRPMSRERQGLKSTRLHRGIPTTTQELQRENTRLSATQVQPPVGVPGNSGVRRGSASKDGDGPARASSSRHVRK